MDGQNDPADITNIFTDKYRSLYNSVGYNIHEMRRLTDRINSSIEFGCSENLKSKDYGHTISVKDVMNAIEALRQGKKEEMDYTLITLRMVQKGYQ